MSACSDRTDNDGDSLIDCADPDCRMSGICLGGAGGGSGATAGGSGSTAGGSAACGTPEDRAGCMCATPGETRPCYGGPFITRNTGTCQDGTQTCMQSGGELSAVWGACTGDVLPVAAEVCSADLDQDCNGASGCSDTACSTDPRCIIECAPMDTRPCYSGPQGTSGVGACRAGVQTCTAMNKWDPACAGQVGPSGESAACTNGIDDDCDGRADCQDTDCLLNMACIPMQCAPNTTRPCYEAAPSTQNVGLCHGGMQTCSADGRMWGACTGQVLPTSESAACGDMADNDCNGLRDCGDPACSTAPACCTPSDGGTVDGTIYAHSATDLYIVNPSGWSVTRVGAFNNGDQITDLAVTPNGNVYGISFDSLYTINKTTGRATLVAGVSGAANNGMTFISNGSLLAAGSSGDVKSINTTTGAVTPRGNFGNGLSSSGDLVAVANGTMYGVSSTTAGGGSASSNNVLIRVDPNTSAATVVGPIGFGNVWGLAYVNAKVIGFTTAGQILQIDPATGQGTLLATRSVVFWGAGTSPLVEANACP
ncbi:MAG: hypothetical protein JNK82_44550 [Myxococcaceae bacterium]|nr:hypothetical protein [Myxococcaceae bacterium]